MLARRIVCRIKDGDQVQQGDRYGMIMLGSRVDLYCPAEVELKVEVGQRVKAGETIIGELLTVFGEPEGEPQALDWLDAEGAVVKQVQGYFYPFSHLDGGLVLVHEPGFSVDGVRLVSP
jgi:hypothetical protein